MKHINLYCDLDGVLADFDEAVYTKTGNYPWNYKEDADLWSAIYQHDPMEFWSSIPLMPGAKQFWDNLVNIAKWRSTSTVQYRAVILSGASRQHRETCEEAKLVWVRDNLSPNATVCITLSRLKRFYARPGSVLIDDRTDNINDWYAAEPRSLGILFPEHLIHHSDPESLKLIYDKIIAQVDSHCLDKGQCRHSNIQLTRVPLRWGSAPAEICLDCGHYRTLDRWLSDWEPGPVPIETELD